MDANNIIRFIAERRKELDLSQNDVAARIGYSAQLVFNWEKGKSLPDLSVISELCNVLGLTLDYFLECKSTDNKVILKPFNPNSFSLCLKNID